MNEQKLPAEHLPVYNIKAVSRLVGLLPVTLRAWERRYGLPSPRRGKQGYRLYSEHDLSTLRWLKQQVESGLSIGRAVQYLHELRQAGQDPARVNLQAVRPQPLVVPEQSPAPNALAELLLQSYLHFDDAGAKETLRRAFALYSIDQVLLEIVTPAMVAIGEMWHAEKLPIAVEHYASQFTMQQLMSMLAASAPPARPGLIVAACAPGETHQIGLLMLVVMLRWRGWDVRYLGPDLHLDRLEDALGPIHPSLILFSANRPETAANMLPVTKIMNRFPEPKPLVVVGGQAFEDFRLPDSVPLVYIHAAANETVSAIEELMMQTTLLPRAH